MNENIDEPIRCLELLRDGYHNELNIKKMTKNASMDLIKTLEGKVYNFNVAIDILNDSGMNQKKV